ncbi:MAG: GNAT family N-acetyltransferase [Acidimicrobiia bacterium]|nr:GNAT family N-acetyltransferase [Acidimicrobiia bacterium]
MGEVSIRPYRPDDLLEVLEVLKVALGESPILHRTPELWSWKHEINPFGRSLVLVAEVDGRIAGVRALMRWDLLTPAGVLLRCLRPVDTATHADFERRGIFRQLTNAAVEQAREDGFDLIFNTPNARSGAGYLTMGWQEVGPIGVMIRPLLRRGSPAGLDTAPDPEVFFDPVPPLIQSLEQPARRSAGLRTPRSIEYLAWRFRRHPHVHYRSISSGDGTAVVRPNVRGGRKEVVVSDLLGIAHRSSVSAAAHQARAAYLVGWFSPGSPERRAALAGGMLPVPGVRSLTLVANPLHELPIDVFQLHNWDLALSDLELL